MFKKILPHICIVLGLMMMTFLIINHFNTAMNFILNKMSLWISFILALSAVILGGVYIHDSRK